MDCITRIKIIEKFFYNPNKQQNEFVVYGENDCKKCPHLVFDVVSRTNYKCRGIIDGLIPVKFMYDTHK
jgi:hypothetical protein